MGMRWRCSALSWINGHHPCRSGICELYLCMCSVQQESLFVCSLVLAFAPDPDEGGYSGLLQHSFSIGGLLYFSIGMWLKMKDFHYNSRKTAIIADIFGLALLVVKIILAHKGIWYFMPATSLPEFLKGVSFPIYLMHSLFLGYWGIFVKNVFL